jgi:uncharacterized damage-inducible protein DinB
VATFFSFKICAAIGLSVRHRLFAKQLKQLTMSIIQLLLKEMEQEAAITRKMLPLVPDDKHDWKPHEKSMTMKQLAVHIAEIPSWVGTIINTEVLDFEAQGYKPTPVNNNKELLALFEKSVADSKAVLEKSNEEDILTKTWTMSSGKTVLLSMTKYEAIRHAFAQEIHHRAQLGVYLRLLNIPIPGSYGPSADDTRF